MVPEEILTICIAAVEAGEDPDEVAARYPEYATELASLLKAVVTLQRSPKPTMSGVGFVAGRRALAMAAARHAAERASQMKTHASTESSTQLQPTESHPTESQSDEDSALLPTATSSIAPSTPSLSDADLSANSQLSYPETELPAELGRAPGRATP